MSATTASSSSSSAPASSKPLLIVLTNENTLCAGSGNPCCATANRPTSACPNPAQSQAAPRTAPTSSAANPSSQQQQPPSTSQTTPSTYAAGQPQPPSQQQQPAGKGGVTTTGVNAVEVAHLYAHFQKKKNIPVVFASPRGGNAPFSPWCMEQAQKDKRISQHLQDPAFLEQLRHTRPLDQVRPEEYAGVLITGSHGAMTDLPDSQRLQHIIAAMHEQHRGYVAAIGHGVAALLNVRTPNGTYLLKDRRATCFSNEEERQIELEHALPYLLETEVRNRGAHVEHAKPFQSHVVVDQCLITAQNMHSVEAWIQAICSMHEAKCSN